MCILTESGTKAEGNLNHRLNKVEHKFANIQIAFDFLSVRTLRDHSKRRGQKNEHGDGINADSNVHSKSNK